MYESKKTVKEYQTYLNIRLEIVRENPVKYIQMRSADHIFNEFQESMLKSPNEIFKAVHLNSKNVILGVETISIGSLTSSLVHPREVFKGAIINNSASILFMHNHPSGDPKPSNEDIEITQRLKQAGDILGIKVLDHIIFGDFKNPYFSFVDEGRL